jgi:F0F1-type ATP synthase delta subunit
MLIKLPSTITNTSQITELMKDLKSAEYESPVVRAFFKANPRISREPQAIKMVIEYLDVIVTKPTELHVTFAQAPDEEFSAELVAWARSNIREDILIKIDIDPMLTGGIVVRSPQRIYDFSWSNLLSTKRDSLIELVSHGH